MGAQDGERVHVPTDDNGKLGYRPELDGLRAIAVGAVILYHFWEGSRLARGGFLGVDLFFVLSGFLITRLLLEERERSGRTNLRAFYKRRAARLLPALFVVCLAVLIDALLWQRLADAEDSVVGVAAAVGYVANWLRVFGMNESPIGHTWSLSIEEQFYVVWPAVLVFVMWRGSLRSVRLWAAAGFVIAAVQMAVRSILGVDDYVLYNSTDAHGAVTLLGGCALATIPTSAVGRIARLAVLPSAGLLLALQVGPHATDDFYYRGGFALVTVASCVIITWALQRGRPQSLLALRPLVWVGRRSYGIYLWHIPAFLFVLSFVDGPPTTAARLTALAATVAVAAASYRFVEQPIRRAVAASTRRRVEAAATATSPPVQILAES